MRQGLSRSCSRLPLVAVVWCLAGCVAEASRIPGRDPQPFDAAFSAVTLTPLHPDSADPLAVPADLLVANGEITVVDLMQSNLKVFDRQGGLIRTVGRPGDGPGEFRQPVSIAPLSGGRFAVLDRRRSMLSVHSAEGTLLREKLIAGTWVGMSAVPGEDRLVISTHGPATSNQVLHEFDDRGDERDAYRRYVRPERRWEAAFSGVFVAAAGRLVLSGAYSSNALLLYDRRTRTERSTRIAPAWYRDPQWPDEHNPSGRTRGWVKQQRLMTHLIPLSDSHYLAAFEAYDSAGAQVYYYAVADTAGNTMDLLGPTPVRLVRTFGRTTYGFVMDPDGNVALWSGQLRSVGGAKSRT